MYKIKIMTKIEVTLDPMKLAIITQYDIKNIIWDIPRLNIIKYKVVEKNSKRVYSLRKHFFHIQNYVQKEFIAEIIINTDYQPSFFWWNKISHSSQLDTLIFITMNPKSGTFSDEQLKFAKIHLEEITNNIAEKIKSLEINN